MWTSLGIQVITKEEMMADELRRRIDTNRNATIERRRLKLLAEAGQHLRDDNWEYDTNDEQLPRRC